MLSWIPPFGVLLRAVGVLAIVGIVVGFIAVWGGFYSVAASRGHWPGFEVFLKFAMRSSVRTHALAIKPPDDLGEADRSRRGGAHFHQACAPCHGSPAGPSMLVVRNMLPPPSDLKDLVPTWKDRELFWIVKNGLKYTGMPPWPTQQRDDEVWDVVAFLRALPSIKPDQYRALSGLSDDDNTEQRSANELRLMSCERCHGAQGRGYEMTAFPRLELQTAPYLFRQLQDYANGIRHSGVMQAATAELSEREMVWLAEHYARRPAAPVAARNSSVGAGETLFMKGVPDQGLPACAACHGDKRDRAYPALLGQHAPYTKTQLELYKQGKRNTTEAAQLMTTIAGRMTDEQVRAVAAYLAAQPGRD